MEGFKKNKYIEGDKISRRDCLKRLGTTLLVSPLLKLDIFDWNEANASIQKDPIVNEKFVLKLFEKPQLIEPEGEYSKQNIKKWRERYNGKDQYYIQRDIAYKKRKGLPGIPIDQELRDGFKRLVKNGHLGMIYNKCSQYEIPFGIVFLALSESHWFNKRSSAGAYGFWQFIPSTARAYDLIIGNHDYRNNPEKSTDAAMKLLKDNFNRTYYWDTMYYFSDEEIENISENDRWLYAMWQYNISPAKVAQKYKLLKGKAKNYSKYQTNRESRNYVDKIFGIKKALIDQKTVILESLKYTKNNIQIPQYDISKKINLLLKKPNLKESQADSLYEYYEKNEKKFPNVNSKIQYLAKVKKFYQIALKEGKLNENYGEESIEIIDDEISDLLKENKDKYNETMTLNGNESNIEVENGDISISIKRKNKETVFADIVEREILPGEGLIKISTWLSGSKEKIPYVKKLLVKLNPPEFVHLYFSKNRWLIIKEKR